MPVYTSKERPPLVGEKVIGREISHKQADAYKREHKPGNIDISVEVKKPLKS